MMNGLTVAVVSWAMPFKVTAPKSPIVGSVSKWGGSATAGVAQSAPTTSATTAAAAMTLRARETHSRPLGRSVLRLSLARQDPAVTRANALG
jgi:hypothetical protein